MNVAATQVLLEAHVRAYSSHALSGRVLSICSVYLLSARRPFPKRLSS
jgi:hypothetical protein